MRNNNKKAVKKLSSRSIKNNKMRNCFAVLAISLTCMMFTVIASMGIGLIQVAQEQTMREVGTKGHAGLKHVTKEQKDQILKDKRIKDSSWNIFISRVENLLFRSGEIRLAGGEDELENTFIEIKEGKYPQAENELLVDSLSLQEWNIPCQVGETVKLEFQFLGKNITKDFLISGWYEGDHISMASQLYVSEAYWKELCGEKTDADFVEWGEEHSDQMGVGLYAVNLFLPSSRQIEEQIKSIITDAGYKPGEEIDYGVNWAYFQSRAKGLDFVSVVILVAVFVIVLVSGYLIICNIFLISITQDIRFYGLLKTIGTTKKQIRSLIRRQALVLSAIGIPIGLLTGFFIGKILLPLTMSTQDLRGMTVNLHFHPVILIFGIIFSLITVLISCHKPEKVAAAISPVEAVHYIEGTVQTKKEKRSKSGAKVHRMALSNLGRNKKKTTMVIASLSFSIVLFCIIVTALESFQIDTYIQSRLIGDVTVGSLFYTSTSMPYVDRDIDQAMLEYLDNQPGIKDSGELWAANNTMTIRLDADAKKRYRSFHEQGFLSEEDEWGQENVRNVLKEGELQTDTYGYDSNLLSYLKVKKGKLDIEKFEKGGYILLSSVLVDTENCDVYEPGDKVTISCVGPKSRFVEIQDEDQKFVNGYWENMEEKEYEVMAVVDIPSSMDEHMYGVNSVQMVLPKQDLLLEGAEGQLLGFCFEKNYELEEEYLDSFIQAADQYTKNQNPVMGYVTKKTLEQAFHGMTRIMGMIGISLSIVIALIGLLNFINSIFTGIITRKREFAILSSIGMTEGQLNRMLLEEGLYYILISGGVGIVLGSLISFGALSALNHLIMFFEYHYSFTAFAIMLPLFTLTAAVIPKIAYMRTKKQSIVERLRDAES